LLEEADALAKGHLLTLTDHARVGEVLRRAVTAHGSCYTRQHFHAGHDSVFTPNW
jgi:hypothetical protein